MGFSEIIFNVRHLYNIYLTVLLANKEKLDSKGTGKNRLLDVKNIIEIFLKIKMEK
jgi:hypothetical protein